MPALHQSRINGERDGGSFSRSYIHIRYVLVQQQQQRHYSHHNKWNTTTTRVEGGFFFRLGGARKINGRWSWHMMGGVRKKLMEREIQDADKISVCVCAKGSWKMYYNICRRRRRKSFSYFSMKNAGCHLTPFPIIFSNPKRSKFVISNLKRLDPGIYFPCLLPRFSLYTRRWIPMTSSSRHL